MSYREHILASKATKAASSTTTHSNGSSSTQAHEPPQFGASRAGTAIWVAVDRITVRESVSSSSSSSGAQTGVVASRALRAPQHNPTPAARAAVEKHDAAVAGGVASECAGSAAFMEEEEEEFIERPLFLCNSAEAGAGVQVHVQEEHLLRRLVQPLCAEPEPTSVGGTDDKPTVPMNTGNKPPLSMKPPVTIVRHRCPLPLEEQDDKMREGEMHSKGGVDACVTPREGFVIRSLAASRGLFSSPLPGSEVSLDGIHVYAIPMYTRVYAFIT